MRLDTRALSQLASRNKTSENFFAYASQRERGIRGSVSKITALHSQMTKEGFAASLTDLGSLFVSLEVLGLGRLSGDEFEWYVSIRDIGASANSPVPTTTFVVCFESQREATVTFTPNLSKEEVSFLCSKLLQAC